MDELDLRILKSILSDNVRGIDFTNIYDHKLFSQDSRLFANLALKYIKAFKAVPTKRTLKEYAGDAYSSQIEQVWNSLDRFSYNTQEYSFDLENFKTRYCIQTIENIKKIAERADKDPDKHIKEIALKLQEIRSIKQGRSFIQRTVREHFPLWADEYDAKKGNPILFERVKSGYSAIDHANGGFAPAELFLIGGESGAGKSMFLLNIAVNMWLGVNSPLHTETFGKGSSILYFSLEMPFDDMFARFLARTASVLERDVLDGSLSENDKEKTQQIRAFIDKYPFEFDIVDIPRGATIQEIELRYNDALLKYKPDVVIIDYLGLMSSPGFNNQPDWLKLGALAGELHEFGRAKEVITGSAVQLTDIQRNANTEKKTEQQRVGGHRIGRSSLILHHANFYIQIDTRHNEELYTDMIYHILKNRRGPKVKNIYLRKNFPCSTLSDLPFSPQTSENSEEALENSGQDITTNVKNIIDKIKERNQ